MKVIRQYYGVMEKYMYDKEITIHEYIEEKDEELNIITEVSDEVIGRIKCNIKPVSQALIKELYGLDIEANHCITCYNSNAKEGQLLKYEGKYHEIKGIYHFDTHTKIFTNET